MKEKRRHTLRWAPLGTYLKPMGLNMLSEGLDLTVAFLVLISAVRQPCL